MSKDVEEKIIKNWPPNIIKIRQHFPDLDRHVPVFAYGNVIYSPFLNDLPEDLIFHERVHFQQQAKFPSPDLWWERYLEDAGFRLEQELEAYVAQYWFVKKHIPKAAKDALFDFSTALSSSLYNLDITTGRAATIIRLREKDYDKN